MDTSPITSVNKFSELRKYRNIYPNSEVFGENTTVSRALSKHATLFNLQVVINDSPLSVYFLTMDMKVKERFEVEILIGIRNGNITLC